MISCAASVPALAGAGRDSPRHNLGSSGWPSSTPAWFRPEVVDDLVRHGLVIEGSGESASAGLAVASKVVGWLGLLLGFPCRAATMVVTMFWPWLHSTPLVD